MAPALTEPMSVTTKLSSSTIKSPAISTRSSNSGNNGKRNCTLMKGTEIPLPTTSSTSPATVSRVQRGQRSKSGSQQVSTRITRSRDSLPQQKTQQQAKKTQPEEQQQEEEDCLKNPTPSCSPVTASKTTKTPPTSKSTTPNAKTVVTPKDEQMCVIEGGENNELQSEPKSDDGATTSSAGEPTPVLGIDSSESNTQMSERRDSTKQLLDDLTFNLEDTINADICLRQHLLVDSNLGKDVSVTGESPSSLNKSNDSSHMDLDLELMKSNELIPQNSNSKGTTNKINQQQQQQKLDSNMFAGDDDCLGDKIEADLEAKLDSLLAQQAALASNANALKKTTVMAITTTVPATVDVEKKFDGETCESAATVAALMAVGQLTPIATDSTISAMETEDNLEERLSQLDGPAVSPDKPETEIVAKTATSPIKQQTSMPLSQHASLPQTPAAPLITSFQSTLPTAPPNNIQNLASHLSSSQQTATSSISGVSNLSQSFLKEGTGTELEEQDIEEVLKALKTLDGVTVQDPFNDFNSIFSEMCTWSDEQMNSYQATTSGSAPTAPQPATTPSTPSTSAAAAAAAATVVTPKSSPIKELDIEKKQQTIQRKIDALLRRMRKMQIRYMSKHVSEEIGGLFEWAARWSAKGKNASEETDENQGRFYTYLSARPPLQSWAEEKNCAVSAAHISTLLQKLEASAVSQQICTNAGSSSSNASKKFKKPCTPASGSSGAEIVDAGASLTKEPKDEDSVVDTLPVKVVDDCRYVMGMLHAELREVQNAIDSDATDSSSGGESGDEMVSYPNNMARPLPIARRAAWKYSRDRAAIASRWAWLLLQISSLEMKISQHNELLAEVIKTKGVVYSNVDNVQKSGDTNSGVNVASGSVNGYKADINLNASAEEQPGACRTRGINTSQYRKRKYFTTKNLYATNKKAARTRNIKCGCQWPKQPCGVCIGRADPTAPRDSPDTMMLLDRVALLDPGFHPVLSFPEDISSTIHFEGIARQPDWQSKCLRIQIKNPAKIFKQDREVSAVVQKKNNNNNNEFRPKRPYIRKKIREKKSGTAAAAATTSASPCTPKNSSLTSTSIAASSPMSGIEGDGAGGELGMSITGAVHATTTPLVANKLEENMKTHCRTMGNGIPLGATTTIKATMDSTLSATGVNVNMKNNINNNYTTIHPTGKCDQLNHNSKNSTMVNNIHHHNNINNNNNNNNSFKYNTKKRKHSSSTISSFPSNNNSFINLNGGGSSSENPYLHSIDITSTAQSRTSSPTFSSYPNKNYERSQSERRRRTSYDIDNIVIPLSVAATTRVEILQCKEIPTPNWRLVDAANGKTDTDKEVTDAVTTEVSSPPAETVADIVSPAPPPPANGLDVKPEKMELELEKKDLNSGNSEEDLTDETIHLRHERALLEERRKYRMYCKYPWNSRSRANWRAVSQAGSSGGNTPDPASPCPNTPSLYGGDQESIPSPLALASMEVAAGGGGGLGLGSESNETSSTMVMPHATSINSAAAMAAALNLSSLYSPISSFAQKRYYERRRTTSMKRDREVFDRRSHTPDLKELAIPYEPFNYPLNDEVYEKMLLDMPLDWIKSSLKQNSFHWPTVKSEESESVELPDSKSINSCDGIIKINNTTMTTTQLDATDPPNKLPRLNGLSNHKPRVGNHLDGDMNKEDEVDVDEEDDDEEDDDDDDKHYLATDDMLMTNSVESYAVNGSLRLNDNGLSETESEPDPFQDHDDPKDPEWKRAPRERVDKLRRK